MAAIHISEDAVCDGKMKPVPGTWWYRSHIQFHILEGLAFN
jgi:hypothetical protein